MRDAVFILGMGRSGTSALARVLSLCGAALPLEPLPPNFGNPTGYWEPALSVAVNDRFLYARGSSWYDAALPDRDEVSSAERRRFVADITGVLAAGFESAGPLVVKDPRISALLPYWTDAASLIGLATKIVHVFRHPDSVAASLAARDELPAAQSNALWLKYNLVAERDARRFPRTFVAYEDLMADWQGVIASCIERLDLTLPPFDVAEAAVTAFLSPILDHHASVAGATDDRGLVARTYALLNDAKRGCCDSAGFDAVLAAYAALERAPVSPPAAERGTG
jgi:hypothetical protein